MLHRAALSENIRVALSVPASHTHSADSHQLLVALPCGARIRDVGLQGTLPGNLSSPRIPSISFFFTIEAWGA